MPARPVPAPYSLDQAVSDEQDFWRHIGELIEAAVEKAMVKHGVPDATKAMQAALRTQAKLIERLNEVSAQQTALVASYDRLAGWCTTRGAEDDLLRLKLDKFFELVTPPASKPTPP